MLLNIKNAGEYLGVSKSTLRRWEKENKIYSLKTIGGHRRYEIKDLEDFKNKMKK